MAREAAEGSPHPRKGPLGQILRIGVIACQPPQIRKNPPVVLGDQFPGSLGIPSLRGGDPGVVRKGHTSPGESQGPGRLDNGKFGTRRICPATGTERHAARDPRTSGRFHLITAVRSTSVSLPTRSGTEVSDNAACRFLGASRSGLQSPECHQDVSRLLVAMRAGSAFHLTVSDVQLRIMIISEAP